MKYGIEDVHVMPLGICEFHGYQLCKVILYLSRRMIWYAYPLHLLSSLVEILCKIYSHDVGYLFHGNQHKKNIF